jgi:riboflavin synthase
MFTGIVTAVGTIETATNGAKGLTLRIRSPWQDLAIGDSIAVDGACLTVETAAGGVFTVHVIATSLERTLFADYRAERKVNLERALAVGDRLGGHMVSGHVDGVGEVLEVRDEGDARILRFTLPAAVAEVTIPLGSITVNGVSLTVNGLAAGVVTGTGAGCLLFVPGTVAANAVVRQDAAPSPTCGQPAPPRSSKAGDRAVALAGNGRIRRLGWQ